MRWQTSDGGDFYLALTDTVISLFVFLQQTLVSKAGSNKRNNGKSLNSWINKITSNQQNKMKGFEPYCLEGSWSCERQMHGKYIKWELKRAGKWIDFFRAITASREERNMIQCRKGDVDYLCPRYITAVLGPEYLYWKSSISSFVRRSWKCWQTTARWVMSAATRLSCLTPRLRKDRSWNDTLWIIMTQCCTPNKLTVYIYSHLHYIKHRDKEWCCWLTLVKQR